MIKVNPTIKTKRFCCGFSLLELMVTVAIIGILSALAMPALQLAMVNAQMTATVSNARNIGIGLKSFATENEGAFPDSLTDGEELTSSNEVFRELLPDYIDSESIFSVKRSAWGKLSDGRIDEESDRLQSGENHFAYIAGLFDSSRSDWPLVVDGTNGSGGYTSTVGEKGGCWQGRKAIVVTVGGAGKLVRLRGDRDDRYLPRFDYPDENALEVANYMGAAAQLLDPE